VVFISDVGHGLGGGGGVRQPDPKVVVFAI